MKLSLIASILSAFVLVEARFGQQNPPVEGKLNSFAQSVSGPFAGALSKSTSALPKSLTGSVDPCDQSRLADEMFGTGKTLTGKQKTDFINLLREYLNAEKNFNPFVAPKQPSFCNDPSLPASKELRGILPLIDPAAKGADAVNAISKQILAQAQGGKDVSAKAQGKSIQQQIEALGFKDCKGCTGSGAAAPSPAAKGGNDGKDAKAGTPPPATGGDGKEPGPGAKSPAPVGGEKKGPACGTVPPGTICTSSGALIVGDPKAILTDCESFHKRCLTKTKNAGDCDNKFKDCKDKVNVKKDFNPNGPKNTFGDI